MKQLVTLISGVVLLLLGLMFSVVILVGVVVVGLLVWGYLWWKTREIRRVTHETPVNRQGGDVIEGEAVVVDDSGV